MKKAWAAKPGFTIVELTITIIVIGILATIMTVSYIGIQQRSRDGERDNEVTQLKIAIEKYHADTSVYPAVCASDNTECAISSLTSALLPYLAVIPHDPTNAVDSSSDYRYIRGATTTDSYGILVSYENRPVCKTGQNITSSWWTTLIPSC